MAIPTGVMGDISISLRKNDGSGGYKILPRFPVLKSSYIFPLTKITPGKYFIKIKQGAISGTSFVFNIANKKDDGILRYDPNAGKLPTIKTTEMIELKVKQRHISLNGPYADLELDKKTIDWGEKVIIKIKYNNIAKGKATFYKSPNSGKTEEIKLVNNSFPEFIGSVTQRPEEDTTYILRVVGKNGQTLDIVKKLKVLWNLSINTFKCSDEVVYGRKGSILLNVSGARSIKLVDLKGKDYTKQLAFNGQYVFAKKIYFTFEYPTRFKLLIKGKDGKTKVAYCDVKEKRALYPK